MLPPRRGNIGLCWPHIEWDLSPVAVILNLRPQPLQRKKWMISGEKSVSGLFLSSLWTSETLKSA